MGSSPRIRGKYQPTPMREPTGGIIPANTGKIDKQGRHRNVHQDHPREYGENARYSQQDPLPWGSSPRIRGKSEEAERRASQGGIIPANTGKMWILRWRRNCGADHPREYGENKSPTLRNCLVRGSSPRIRGKSFSARNAGNRGGIIPANTGKISQIVDSACGVWDHPREYGEN